MSSFRPDYAHSSTYPLPRQNQDSPRASPLRFLPYSSSLILPGYSCSNQIPVPAVLWASEWYKWTGFPPDYLCVMTSPGNAKFSITVRLAIVKAVMADVWASA
ncbi:hypothetical protein GB937_002552 [Aspergillus fischeri]|nr:hypothetical protein GB937_002552 [Aspergillus fischeri]